MRAADTPAKGDVVGALQVELPSTNTFVLHGTLPLPRGVWTGGNDIAPFRVLDANGKPVATQTNVLSRYASAADGVEAAEIVARVTRPPWLVAGQNAVYLVTWDPQPGPGSAPAWLGTLALGPQAVPASVQLLLYTPDALVIEARDVFGNSYIAKPFDGTGTAELLKYGPVQAELRIAQTLMPKTVVTGALGTLPHHLGIHAYLTTTSQSEVVGLDLRFHNAHSGKNKEDPTDDPLGLVYFESIRVRLPAGWSLVQDYVDPFFGAPETSGGYVTTPLVKPYGGGKMHVIEWQGQFHRRLAITPTKDVSRTLALLRGAGLGFARAYENPITHQDLWSWWNPKTARWFPQSQLLPSLKHVGSTEVAVEVAQEFGKILPHLETGTTYGDYPVPTTVLGWAHPYGMAYGGMAGGSEIFLFDGVPTVESASLDGYRLSRITHRMHTDRMPDALYNGDGTPSSVKDWLVTSGGMKYIPFHHFLQPSLEGTDPFGVYKAPTFQVDFVDSFHVAADYAPTLIGYSPHDFQHFIRYTRSAKTLAWLANDSLAKDDLRLQAENFHLSYHSYYNSPGGDIQVSGLLYDRMEVDQNPGQGFSFGRGEAWALDCAVAAYATASPAWRAEKRPWFDEIASVLADGQGACNGFIQSTVNSKFVDGKYRARQMIEQSITENAIVGMIEKVYRGEDTGRAKMLEDVLKASLYAAISPMAWGPGQHAPWAYAAVGPLDGSLPVWCKVSDVPADGHSDWTDSYQNWSSFAYGYLGTQDPIFLLFAQLQAGGSDLFTTLHQHGLDNIENRAALLALVQKLAGTL